MPNHVQPFLPDLLADRLSGEPLTLQTLESQMYLPFNLLEVNLQGRGVEVSFWQGQRSVFTRFHHGQQFGRTKFVLSGMLPVSPGPREPTELEPDRYRLF